MHGTLMGGFYCILAAAEGPLGLNEAHNKGGQFKVQGGARYCLGGIAFAAGLPGEPTFVLT